MKESGKDSLKKKKNKRKIRKDVMTGEIVKKGGTLNNLNIFERLNKNRKISNGFGIWEILATLKKAISVNGQSRNQMRTGENDGEVIY